jgi:hypothetical protein
MAVRRLPVRVGVPFQRFQVELDGVLYGVELRWNWRVPAWSLTLRDAGGGALRQGVRVCLGASLLPPRRSSAFPPGELLLVDRSGSAVDPGLEGLGDTAELVYMDAAEVAGVT